MQKKSLPFVVPADSMWEAVTVGTAEKKVTSLQLGQSLNDAMLAIERANAPKFDGTRACYQHRCLCHVAGHQMTNATLRQRFGRSTKKCMLRALLGLRISPE
jgi:hypothetical protein